MAEYNWHEDFFKRKVYPQICRDAGDCAGFFAWLEVSEKQLYDEILRLEQELDALWLAQGYRERFQRACREWYRAVMAGIEKWKQALAINQEIAARSQKPVEPEQIKMI